MKSKKPRFVGELILSDAKTGAKEADLADDIRRWRGSVFVSEKKNGDQHTGSSR